MRAEVAVLRRDAVPAGMKSRTVGRLKFALFVPAADAALPLAELLARRPVATTTGGSFRKSLDAAAKKARVQLRIEFGCESFTHAARALRGGKYAAILPDMAAAELPGFAAVPPSSRWRAFYPGRLRAVRRTGLRSDAGWNHVALAFSHATPLASPPNECLAAP